LPGTDIDNALREQKLNYLTVKPSRIGSVLEPCRWLWEGQRHDVTLPSQYFQDLHSHHERLKVRVSVARSCVACVT